MFPYPTDGHRTVPPPLPRTIWQDLGLTPEQWVRLGPLIDVPGHAARASCFLAPRRVVGAGLVRLGQLVQGLPAARMAGAAPDPVGDAS